MDPVTATERRQEAMAALGQEVAARPWNIEQIKVACQGIRAVAKDDATADGLVLEACLTAAAFEAVTKVVDGTMRKRLSPINEGVLAIVNFIGRTMQRIWSSFVRR